MYRYRYQVLTVNLKTGKTYWQKSHATLSEAKKHAFRYTRNPCDLLFYKIPKDDNKQIILDDIIYGEL